MKIALSIIFALAGCAQQPSAETARYIEIPSAKPYRYLTFSKADTPQTIREIKAHNRAHQAVINAEKKVIQP